MTIIYRTKPFKPNKYTRIINEYEQHGDRIEKYQIKKTKVPGRLESGEDRTQIGRYCVAEWNFYDPEMPQWLNQYIKKEELDVEERLFFLEESGYRICYRDKEIILAIKGNRIKVFYQETWEDITNLILSYYGRKRLSEKFIHHFEQEWQRGLVTYSGLVQWQEEQVTKQKEEKRRVTYEKLLAEVGDPNQAFNHLIQKVHSCILSFKKDDKRISLLENLLSDLSHEERTKEIYVTYHLRFMDSISYLRKK